MRIVSPNPESLTPVKVSFSGKGHSIRWRLQMRLARISHRVSSRGRRGAAPSGVFDLEARPRPTVPSADGARAPRSRREKESMPKHRRRRATQRSATIPIGPKGCGGMAPPSSFPLLGDGGTSPSSRRLESGPMAHATDDAVGPGRASQGAERVLAVRYGAPSALVSHRHQRVSDGLAYRRAFGHIALLSAGRAPRGEKTPLGAIYRRLQQKAGEICGFRGGRYFRRSALG